MVLSGSASVSGAPVLAGNARLAGVVLPLSEVEEDTGYALVAANNYVGFVGDSLTTAGGDMNGTYRFWNTSGGVGSYAAWAMSLPATGVAGSEGKPIWAGSSALSGQIISVIKSTYWPPMRDATPKRGIVVFMAGSNDIGTISPGGVVSAPVLAGRLADLEDMYEDALANGILPVACTVPPNGTANNRPGLLALNDGIRTLAASLNIPLADTFVPVGNAGTGDWLNANYQSGDGIHYSTAGARLSGQVLRDRLEEILIPEATIPFPTEADPTMGGTQRWFGGLFDTDGNANGRPDGGFIALVADAWGASSNGGTISNPDGGSEVEGRYLRHNKTGTPASGSASTTPSTGNAPLAVTTGDKFVIGFKFKVLSPSTTLVGMGLTLVQATDGAHTLFQFTTYGQIADMTGLALRILTRAAQSSQTNMRWSHQVTISSTGGLADVYTAQLGVKGPV